MPHLRKMILFGSIPKCPSSKTTLSFASSSQIPSIITLPHLWSLDIVCERGTFDALDISYTLRHLYLPALERIHIESGFTESWYQHYKVGPLIEAFEPLCHGPQDSDPIQALAIIRPPYRDNDGTHPKPSVTVIGWTVSDPKDDDGIPLLSNLGGKFDFAEDSARFWLAYEDLGGRRNSALSTVSSILSTYPLSHVTSLAVDGTLWCADCGTTGRPAWWLEHHQLFPSLSRLYIQEKTFENFCFAFTSHKDDPMQKARETSLKLEHLIFPNLRYLHISKAKFSCSGSAELFIQALQTRRDLGVGIEKFEIVEFGVDAAFVKRLSDVVQTVIWDSKAQSMDDCMDEQVGRGFPSDREFR